MESAKVELPAFSQMVQMFPNIPHDTIWMYLQECNDTEKCLQILNLQNMKYGQIQTIYPVHSYNFDETNNELKENTIQPSVLLNSDNENLEQFAPLNISIDNQPVYNEPGLNCSVSNLNANAKNLPLHIPTSDFTSIKHNQQSSNYDPNFQQLTLDICENDDYHSWIPSTSMNSLCADFFLPSPVVENPLQNIMDVPNVTLDCFSPSHDHRTYWENYSDEDMRSSEINLSLKESSADIIFPQMDPSGDVNGMQTKSYAGVNLQNNENYQIDVQSYLNCQKSQMNAIRYEVIKAKIDLSDLKETVEKLTQEHNQQRKAKNAQDIEELNKEIATLQLECQCLCTEVDFTMKGQVLLGEIDEKCYQKKIPYKEDCSSMTKAISAETNKANQEDKNSSSNRWQCSKCTFENHSNSSLCEICDFKRPILKDLSDSFEASTLNCDSVKNQS